MRAKDVTAALGQATQIVSAAGWHAFTLTIDWILAIVRAVAPFAAALAVLAALAALVWWTRRRLQARGAGRVTASGQVGD
jgi:TRAP-type C4-dicarboxylate transport system permease small subunit